MAAKGLTPFPPRGRGEGEPPARVGEVQPGGGKRPRVTYPCWGLPRGEARRPLLLLLPIARPHLRREAVPALRSVPSRAQAGRRGASIRPRRSRTVPSARPASQRRRRRRLLAPGLRRSRRGGRALPRPPGRRLSQSRSLPQQEWDLPVRPGLWLQPGARLPLLPTATAVLERDTQY